MAPAAFIRVTVGESMGGSASTSAGTPWVVAEPVQSMFFLMVNGTPRNGPTASVASADFRHSSSAMTRVHSPSCLVGGGTFPGG